MIRHLFQRADNRGCGRYCFHLSQSEQDSAWREGGRCTMTDSTPVPALRSRKFMRARVLLSFWRFDWFDYWGGCRRFIRDRNAASLGLTDLCH